MRNVYLLQSADQEHWYVGSSNNVERRLSEHNAGMSIHTRKHKPWKLQVHISFASQECANAFEHYLKSHSGRAFAKRHFWSNSAKLEKQ